MPKPRLQFIDMARSVAIVLMLEGHFVDVVLRESSRDLSHPAYALWHYGRGLAAPMFFTATGLIFAYLLTGGPGGPLRQMPRVRKGFRRALELLFWGYLLQCNVRKIPQYLRGEAEDWLFAFHVLQCIGVGILVLIAVYAVQRRLRRVPLPLCYVMVGMAWVVFAGWLRNRPEGAYFPSQAPQWLQNVFRGKNSVFPLAPWLAFVCYGAAFGALLRRLPEQIRKPWFAPAVIAAGVLLRLTGDRIDRFLAGLPGRWSDAPWNTQQWLHPRVGEILILLGVLVWIERRLRLRDSWFLRMGQNTLPIYFFHVIVLYSAIFGIGISRVWSKALGPWQTAAGAVLFVGLFGCLASTVGPLQRGWNAWKEKVWPRRQIP